jgi:hypothetical protein
VFKYTTSGTLAGSWTIDSRNSNPTGITIDPSNVNHIWIVDSVDDAVYRYHAAAGRSSGSQAAVSLFQLASGNTNPQGIADPPPTALEAALPQAVVRFSDQLAPQRRLPVGVRDRLFGEWPASASGADLSTQSPWSGGLRANRSSKTGARFATANVAMDRAPLMTKFDGVSSHEMDRLDKYAVEIGNAFRDVELRIGAAESYEELIGASVDEAITEVFGN